MRRMSAVPCVFPVASRPEAFAAGAAAVVRVVALAVLAAPVVVQACEAVAAGRRGTAALAVATGRAWVPTPPGLRPALRRAMTRRVRWAEAGVADQRASPAISTSRAATPSAACRTRARPATADAAAGHVTASAHRQCPSNQSSHWAVAAAAVALIVVVV